MISKKTKWQTVAFMLLTVLSSCILSTFLSACATDTPAGQGLQTINDVKPCSLDQNNNNGIICNGIPFTIHNDHSITFPNGYTLRENFNLIDHNCGKFIPTDIGDNPKHPEYFFVSYAAADCNPQYVIGFFEYPPSAPSDNYWYFDPQNTSATGDFRIQLTDGTFRKVTVNTSDTPIKITYITVR